MSNLTFRITGGTNVGLIRSNNEDNFIINADLSKSDWFIPSDTNLAIELGESGCLFVVADGMGGMNAGEVASAIAIDTIKEIFTRDDFSPIIGSDDEIALFMKEAIEVADENIKAKVLEDKSTAGMGTTIVMAWVIGQKVHIAWCGDSRAYLFNTKSGLVPLSKDHSYVQELVDEGKLDPELAFDHPDSNIITRSLGDSSTKARPDYMSRKLSEGDLILLCSDGLCGLCRDDEIVEVLAGEYDSIEQLKTRLIERALEAGGYDNVTVAIFQTLQTESVVASEMQQTSTDVGRVDLMPTPSRRKLQRLLTKVAMLAVLITLAFVFIPNNKENKQTEDQPEPTTNQTEQTTADKPKPTDEPEVVPDEGDVVKEDDDSSKVIIVAEPAEVKLVEPEKPKQTNKQTSKKSTAVKSKKRQKKDNSVSQSATTETTQAVKPEPIPVTNVANSATEKPAIQTEEKSSVEGTTDKLKLEHPSDNQKVNASADSTQQKQVDPKTLFPAQPNVEDSNKESESKK
ncbi:MAG: protein phosphatase 2C domain-containing protein [Alistipes sp.]|nr:protein phosphatase 2C domain-containing protein [Rikenellaceae bacterium]MBR3792835.1 protein phosphatase 2C domain-containing protein [Alistipes sp.]